MRRGLVTATVSLLMMALVTGCAGVPSGSRVLSGKQHSGREQPLDDPYVRIIPVGPGRDYDPSAIVSGFLTASASFDGPHGEHRVAREYLASGARWQPTVSSIVYDQLDLQPTRQDADESSVTVTGRQLGEIQRDGQYSAQVKRFEQTFRLRRDAQKQWRISELPQDLLLSRDDVDRAFRTLNLYFFAQDAQVLVPNPVFVPLVNREGLALQTVRQLIRGPTSWLKDAGVRTAFPPGTQLRRLRVENGVATVDLTRQARGGDLRSMSVQLMWTLQQQREIQQLTLEIEGKPVRVPGASGIVQSARDWSGYDPDDSGSAQIYAYVRANDGRLATLIGDRLQALAGKLRVRQPAISHDGAKVAFLSDNGDMLTVADLGGGTIRLVKHAAERGRFSTPSWDRRGNVWAAESYDGGSRLWVIEHGSKAVSVDGWGLSQYPVRALRISRDGNRAAAIVQKPGVPAVQLGRVDRAPSGGLQAEGFIPISSELPSAADLAWRNADHLVVLGNTQKNPSVLVYDVPVSGAPVQALGGPGGEMTAIAAYPDAPLLVKQRLVKPQSASEHVCRLSDRLADWQCFNEGSDPAYPG